MLEMAIITSQKPDMLIVSWLLTMVIFLAAALSTSLISILLSKLWRIGTDCTLVCNLNIKEH